MSVFALDVGTLVLAVERGTAWSNKTTLHPIGLAAIIVLGCAMLLIRRQYAIVPMICMACLVATAQRIVVFGLDFDVLRILVLIGWARVLIRGELAGIRWRPADTVFLLWVIVGLIAMCLLHHSSSAVINRLGWAYTAAGMYFLFRVLLRSWDDIRQVIVAFMWISIPVSIAFMIEQATHRNMFAIFGGVPEFTQVRDGRLRCQGAFSHPILAGCFWAGVVPMMIGIWRLPNTNRLLAAVGIICSCMCVGMCASSTPLLSLAFGFCGMALFPLRAWAGIARWVGLAVLVCLHMVMNAPVWHLISRVDIVGGSTGWHRYYLIDQAIGRVGEWWMLGTKSTAHWGLGLWDVTNEFILQAVQGGIGTLLLFVLMIAASFRSIGRMMRNTSDRRILFALWGLGVAIFVHCLSFFGVSYFGQITMLWYLSLAVIVSLDEQYVEAGRRLSYAARNAAAARVSAAGPLVQG